LQCWPLQLELRIANPHPGCTKTLWSERYRRGNKCTTSVKWGMSRRGLCFPTFAAITFRMEGLTPRGGKLLSRLQLADGLVTFPRTVPSFNPDGQKVFQVWWLRILALELRTSASYVCDVAGWCWRTHYIFLFQCSSLCMQSWWFMKYQHTFLSVCRFRWI
jgi:hypothetical protein